ncbi:MAG: nicotinate-nucleotide--dimethylbenzimidazole phosphoribosyltransferase [Agarilytica sp.]
MSPSNSTSPDSHTATKSWFLSPCKTPDQGWLEKARHHQNNLTKPQGSLGKLEELAISFCAYQQTLRPEINNICVRVFAGDHGVCAQNISAFPQSVTAQMVDNFRHGGAAISVLSRELGADFSVINMGVVNTPTSDNAVTEDFIRAGTHDFTERAAMDLDECYKALDSGRKHVRNDADLFIGGEMGIGNTTSASAILALLLELEPKNTVGPGTGLAREAIEHKCAVIERSIQRHSAHTKAPLQALQYFGGFEITALAGAYISCGQKGIPVLVDGFISTAAALAAAKINPSITPWFIFSHMSAEPGHIHTLNFFGAKPLLDLNMRLGEGSGAAVAVPLIKTAIALHNNMASFESAGVSVAKE